MQNTTSSIEIKTSAVIPTYNSSNFIIETLDSLKNQIYPLSEIIIVDDHSSDKTFERCQEWANSSDIPTRVIKSPDRSGEAIVRNIGVRHAQYEWILFMDHDDVACPTLLEQECLRYNTLKMEYPQQEVALIQTGYYQIDRFGKTISDPIIGEELLPEEILGALFIRNFIFTLSGLLLKRGLFLQLGGFDSSLKLAIDWDFWLRLAQLKLLWGYVNKPLIAIRRHETNLSRNLEPVLEAERVVLQKYTPEFIESSIHQRHLPWETNQVEFASILFRLNLWEDGFKVLQNVLDAKASTPALEFYLGLFYLQGDKFKIAHSHFEKVIFQSPHHGAALNNLAICYALQREPEKAKKYLIRALDSFPQYLDARHNLNILNTKSATIFNVTDFRITQRELRPVLLQYCQ